jgi:methanogenic corrinoid protein MtbC1
MIEEMLTGCRELSNVSTKSAEAYASATERLLKHVKGQLEANPNIKELIGRNPLEMMHDINRKHAALMLTVFRINSFELLARTLPWVYRAYHARGFSYDYFPAELMAWRLAIHECLDHTVRKEEILAVYEWLAQHNEGMVKLALTGEGLSFSIQREPNEMQQVFLTMLLNGDSHGCLKMVDQSIFTVDDLKHFYLDVVCPAMYRIGHLWESNQISIVEEHLATAIVGRVMSDLYPRFARFTVIRGKTVVSAGPNEFHEIGARMVADFMELDGWDVSYLGANTPAEEMLDIFKRQKPFTVALSVATVFSLDNARYVIQMINEDRETRDIKVLVGGLAFNGMSQLWQDIGADGYAADADRAVFVCNEWWLARNA